MDTLINIASGIFLFSIVFNLIIGAIQIFNRCLENRRNIINRHDLMDDYDD